MDTLQAIFNNREIAVGFWVMVSGIALLFVKSARKPLKKIIILLLSKKFIAFYLVFAGFLFLVLAFLKWIGFWNINLLKDTVFWVLLVEFPIFVKTIEKAKDNRFFGNLIKENIALSVIIEFFVGFWTFSLWVEIILIPITVFFLSLIHICGGAAVPCVSVYRYPGHREDDLRQDPGQSGELRTAGKWKPLQPLSQLSRYRKRRISGRAGAGCCFQ